eukprot:gene1946-2275_t
MEATRDVARKLAEAGIIEITQKGAVVSPQSFKGPIRLRLAGGLTATATPNQQSVPAPEQQDQQHIEQQEQQISETAEV